MRLIAVLLLTCSTAFAGESCPKQEYARLKDSSRKELTDEFCSATRKAALNKDLIAIRQELFEKQLAMGADARGTAKELSEMREAHVSCLAAAEDAAQMLQKKFKAAPTCRASS